MNLVRSLVRAGVALSVCLLLALSAFAQSDNSTISGTVTDPSGASVPNAKVTVRNETTSFSRDATTNESGGFVVPSVPSGLYTVTVESAGFKKYESKNNKVDPNLSASFSIALQVGTATEVVEVTASAVAIQTESPTLGKLIEGKQISNLQLNGRNPIFLALLKPGVRGGSLGGFSFDLTSGGFAINGSRSQDNLITMDGAVGVRTRSNGTSIGTADLDSVQEVQILTANYAAEYGRSSGGQIRIITKTGGQRFHGAAYEYFRNNNMDANSWSRNRSAATNFQAPFKFNQFGYNFNGPVFIPKVFNKDRSKIFFNWSQEWTKRRLVQQIFRTVPTAEMRVGNFGNLLTTPNIFFGTPQIIRDPQNGNAPFAGNVIPTNRLSPNGLALMKVYPAANFSSPGINSNYYSEASAPTDQRKDSIGVDLMATQKDQIKFRGQLFHYYDKNPSQTGFFISAREFTRPNQSGSVSWIRNISPTLLNEFFVSASRDQVFIRMEEGPAFDRATYGINYPYVFAEKDRQNKLPAVDIPGLSGYTGSPYPSNSTGPIYNIQENLTKITGNHTLKFGFAFERAGQNDYDQINIQGVPGGTDNQNGRFQFSNSRPGGSSVALGDVALGLFDSYAEIGNRSFTPYRGHMYEWYAQDTWKTTRKLTLTFGLRHSIIQPYYSLWGNMAIFDPKYYDRAKAVTVNRTTGNPIAGTGDPVNGLLIPGTGWPEAAKGRVPIATTGEFNSLFRGEPKEYSNWARPFQPRVGLAYTITPKTVVRAGIGRFTTRLGVSDSVFLGGNPPLQPLASIATGSVDNPGGGSRSSFPLSPSTQARDFPMPESWAWNGTVEREIGFNTVLEVSYVGRRGLHGQRERNINQPVAGTIQANPGVNVNALRPFPGYGPIRITENVANSQYHGLQIGANRRFKNGFLFGVAYTLSKTEDDGSAQRDVIPDNYNARWLWGPATYDTRHLAVINFVYELPFFKENDLKGKILGGWEISGVTQFQTGTPFTVNTSDDFAGIGPGSGNNFGSFWKINGDAVLPNGEKKFAASATDPNYWFRTTNGGSPVFTAPAAGTFVTDRVRNQIYNPGFQNWNIGLFKSFRITESQRVTFRAEGFNWINHPNWNGADTNPRNVTFGKVTGKSSERNLQLSLRYQF